MLVECVGIVVGVGFRSHGVSVKVGLVLLLGDGEHVVNYIGRQCVCVDRLGRPRCCILLRKLYTLFDTRSERRCLTILRCDGLLLI